MKSLVFQEIPDGNQVVETWLATHFISFPIRAENFQFNRPNRWSDALLTYHPAGSAPDLDIEQI